MRFLPDGPSIPDDLLEQRDKGNVVFFCGAGISLAAGLPSFLGLANQVVNKLGVPADGKARILLDRATQDPDFAPPLDQVFNVLQQDYGAGLVDSVVSRLLETPRNASVEQHSIVLRLSRGSTGRPQIVTTNFDRLFEKARGRLRLHVWPALPDLASGQPFEGIVYLHGRRSAARSNGADRQGLVLSSADFGRAYLAEGWATTFVRDLLRSYSIVLLGYSASDPPVRYLLEGLHSLRGERAASIYAFDHGSVDEVLERWRHRGVHPLPYSKSDSSHASLWKTLHAWADRADDPDSWRKNIIDMARAGPKNLQPCQRGQVVSIIRTVAGATLFADANPSPPGEWLCVFDRNVRFAKPGKGFGENVDFDPLTQYGLDDDPPRPVQGGEKPEPIGDDLISHLSTDETVDNLRRLAGVPARWSDPLPPRLAQLTRWLSNNLTDPAVAWWLAGYKDIHLSLLHQIEWHVEHSQKQYDILAYKAWKLLLETLRRSSAVEDAWYHFVSKLKKDGWTTATTREFGRAIEPYLSASRPWLQRPEPPRGTWSDLRLDQIATFEVQFPARELGTVRIPTENLIPVFRVLRRSLERAAELLAEIDERYWHTATFHPENGTEDRYLRDADRYLHCFITLFERLATEHSDFARAEVKCWPENDEYFFDKLKIYAWMNTTLFTGDEAIDGILRLSDHSFWNSYQRRELLHTLRSQWNNLSMGVRERIEGRIIAGPAKWSTESDEDYKKRKAISAATTLGWLAKHNCQLSADAAGVLPSLREVDPNWRQSWDDSADHSFDTRGGAVRVEPDPTKLVDAPLSGLIEVAREHSMHARSDLVEYRPFQGLVQQRPFRALSALSYERRKGRFAQEFWQIMLSYWPENTKPRLSWWCARSIASLPTEIVAQLSHYIPDWYSKHLPILAKASLDGALEVWDGVLDKLFTAGKEAVKSSIGEVSIGGEPQHRSRRTYMNAINSPVGRMAETLFAILAEQHLGQNEGIPVSFRQRIERLLEAPGEGADHAISEASLRLRWLHYIDPEWTLRRILPFLDPSHTYAEPAWSGYLHDNVVASAELFSYLKPYFLQMFRSAAQWKWDDSPYHKLSEFLIVACFWSLKDNRFVSYKEARTALQALDDESRAHAVWFLSRVVREQRCWKSFGKPFIEQAWPREKKCRTMAVSRNFAFLAEQSGRHFPDVVRTITPFLTPVDHLDMITHGINEDQEDGNVAAKYPEPTLTLLDRLIPSNPQRGPYNLATILDVMAESLPRLQQDERWRRLNRLTNRA